MAGVVGAAVYAMVLIVIRGVTLDELRTLRQAL
jgi:hypothetical protein